jgi:hypothetical protein
MSDNPMTDVFNAAEKDQKASRSSGSNDEFDPEQYLDALDSEPVSKDEAVVIAVTAEMHTFYQERQNAEEVEANPARSIREHIQKLVHRHPEVFEKTIRKLEIKREF